MDIKNFKGLMEAYQQVYSPQEELDEAEGSYGETPKAYSAASKTKMTAKRKPFLKKMMSRTNPANRKDAYASPRKGMTASDREEARAGAAYGSPRGHDYPSQGPGGVTKNPKKLRKQKAMGEFAKEELDIFDIVLEFLQAEGIAETLEEAEWLMANMIDEEAIGIILGEEQLDEISQKTATRAFASRGTNEFESDGDDPRDFTKSGKSKADETKRRIEKKFGKKAGQHAERAVHKGIYGRKGVYSMPKVDEEYVDEAQHARENPEKYEREQAKKSAPVRGERTPMPPRGDKRREEFEKWYAKQMGR